MSEIFSINDKKIIKESYSKYITDESRLEGELPKNIFFPKTTQELSQIVSKINSLNQTITVSGARTGITGGAVNINCDNIISLEHLKFKPTILKNTFWSVKVGAGTTLNELDNMLKNKEYHTVEKNIPALFYPVDPTETSASIGGTIGTNASGARTFFYGPTRNHVLSLTVVLFDGTILKINRGQYKFNNYELNLKINGKNINLIIDKIKLPKTKHVAGYFMHKDMDLIDLFIGSEGTIGIISEAELKLSKTFENNLYLTVFCDKKTDFGNFVIDLKKSEIKNIIAIEFMDYKSCNLLKNNFNKFGHTAGSYEFSSNFDCIIYIEFGYEKEDYLEKLYHILKSIFDKYYININNTWAGFSKKYSIEMKKLRHSLPESVNNIIATKKNIDSRITKIGTDMAVPLNKLTETLNLYYSTLEVSGLEYVIFGHIGNGHLHINIIPNNYSDLIRGKELYLKLAIKIINFSGSISAEHGIGKIKKDFMEIQYSKQELLSMLKIKNTLDPKNILNPGVLL